MLSYAPPLLGSTTPRLWTPPLAVGPPGPCGCGCALTPATSLGFSAVDFTQDPIGIQPLPWQRFLLIHALELVGGRFRFRTVLILVARQNGKTTIVEVKNLWKLFVLGVPLVIGTAQTLDIAEESWDKAVEIIEGTPDLAAELVTVNKVNGKKFLKLKSGGRWKVAAASRRARGLAGDDINLDELREHQTWKAWGAVTKTTMARSNAQIFGFSNAGDNASVVLNDLQAKGRAAAAAPAAADPSLGLFEWSAPDDTKCTCRRLEEQPHKPDCQLLDRRLWAMANPSLGHPGGVSEGALASAAATDPNEIFLTECLCVRVPDLAGRAINPAAWKDLGDPESRRDGDVALAVDISLDRDWAAIGLYGHRTDGIGHAQLVYYGPVQGLVGKLVEFRDALDPVAVGLARGTYASLKEDLARVGFVRPEDRPAVKVDEGEDRHPPQRGDLIVLSGVDMAAACGQIIDAVRQATVRHVPSEQLTADVGVGRTRKIGDTIAWAQGVTGLVTVTEARWTFYARVDAVRVPDRDPVGVW